MRPWSIIVFERLFAATIATQAAYVVVSWVRPDGWLDQIPDMGWGRLTYVVLASIFGLAIHGLLLFFAARRPSETARGLVGILLIFRFFAFGRFLWIGNDPMSMTGILMLFALSLHSLAAWFMCRGDANEWFSGRWNKVDSEVFR